VSGKGRSVGVIRDQLGQRAYENFIQVDAAINPGNSGGPLTDFRGRVIGMNTAIATGRRNSLEDGAFAGIGLAIPMSMIEPVVMQLIQTGVVQKGFLGISGVQRDDPVARELVGLTRQGVIVGRIRPSSEAYDAGLRFGDVLLEVAGRPVRTERELRDVADAVRSDDAVSAIVWHYPTGNEWRRTVVADEQIFGEERQLVLPVNVVRSFTGVSFLEIDSTIADGLDLLGFKGRGVRVSWAQPDGPARAAGVRRYDLITHVNDEPIGTMQQLQSVISSIPPGEEAHLTIWRYDPEVDQGETIGISVPLARLDTLRVRGVLPPDQSRTEIPELGIAQMATATPELAERYGMPFTSGVVIERVVDNSELDGRIIPGSTIVAISDNLITDVDDLLDVLSRFDLRSHVRATLVSPGGRRYEVRLRVQL
jgi:S1-C subfamily serine protease